MSSKIKYSAILGSLGQTCDRFMKCGYKDPELDKVEFPDVVKSLEKMQVLQGARGCIDAGQPWIIFELTDAYLRQMGSSSTEILRWLTDRGYALHHIATDGLHPLDPTDRRAVNVLASPSGRTPPPSLQALLADAVGRGDAQRLRRRPPPERARDPAVAPLTRAGSTSGHQLSSISRLLSSPTSSSTSIVTSSATSTRIRMPSCTKATSLWRSNWSARRCSHLAASSRDRRCSRSISISSMGVSLAEHRPPR